MNVILVLNNDPELTDSLTDLLQMEGYECRALTFNEFKQRREAALKEFNPMLILFDLAPPFRETFELLESVRTTEFQHGRQLAVFTINQEFVKNYRPPGVAAVFSKPFELEEFLAVIRHALRVT